MHVGAIVTIPNAVGLDGNPDRNAKTSIAGWEVLGSSVLNRVLERLRVFGIGDIAVLSEQHGTSAIGGEAFWNLWESNVGRYVSYGVSVLVLARVGSYSELDFGDLLRFHREGQSLLTEVHDQQGPLEVVVVNAAHLRDGNGSYRSRLRNVLSKPQHYRFAGYSNRLRSVSDFRRLAKDALLGRAAIRPFGEEIAPNVWMGEGAQIDASALVEGPAYIGQDSRIRAGVKICGMSAVEQRCEIDCGTTVDDSCVMPKTYVGPGLNVSGAVAAENTLFHLRRNVKLQFNDRRLLSAIGAGRGWLPPTYLWSQRGSGRLVQ